MWISNKIYYLIAALRKLRQENHGLENTLNYVEIPFQKKKLKPHCDTVKD